jgi:hypothetical protein
MSLNGYGALRQVLETSRQALKISRADLTVLSTQVDPYRLDTAAGHRDGAWLADQLERIVGPDRRIHLRGIHYAIVATGEVRKPDGSTYINDDANWTWLSTVAAKAARWLGYVDFERIVDNRSSEPIIHRKARVEAETFVSIGVDVTIPDIDDLEPYAGVTGFKGRQPYGLTIYGEKASLEEVVLPIAKRYEADLYLQTGEISDTRLYRIARDGAADGRPQVVFVIADFDPSGHQMAISIGRKMQAFRDLRFPDLEFEVVPIALTADQVRDLDLPSTPLKPTEKRADRWREAFGAEQTEIDALCQLRPAALREIVETAVSPYFDKSLDGRVSQARRDWQEAAQEMLARQVDRAVLDELRSHAAERLAELESEINAINERLQMAAAGQFDLPPIVIPGPQIDPNLTRPASLISTKQSWAEATRALIARKAYANEEVAP